MVVQCKTEHHIRGYSPKSLSLRLNQGTGGIVNKIVFSIVGILAFIGMVALVNLFSGPKVEDRVAYHLEKESPDSTIVWMNGSSWLLLVEYDTRGERRTILYSVAPQGKVYGAYGQDIEAFFEPGNKAYTMELAKYSRNREKFFRVLTE